jgi:hypothetical protein
MVKDNIEKEYEINVKKIKGQKEENEFNNSH